MMRKPPMNYKSWVEFYDVFKNDPMLKKNKTLFITNAHIFPNGKKVVEYFKIRWDTVERNCWREIQEHRFIENDTWNKIIKL